MPGGAVGGLARKPSPNSVAPTSTSPSGEMESRNCARVCILIIKSTKKFSFSFEPFGEQEAQDQCWHKEERKRRQRRLAQATLKMEKTDLAKTSFNKKIRVDGIQNEDQRWKEVEEGGERGGLVRHDNHHLHPHSFSS